MHLVIAVWGLFTLLGYLSIPLVAMNTLTLINCLAIRWASNQWIKVLMLINDSLCGIPITSLHGGSGDGAGKAVSSGNSGGTSSVRRRATKRTRDCNQSDNNPLEDRPPKKRAGRPSNYHPYQPCGPCSIWLQTGRDSRLIQYHISSPMRHPGQNAESMCAYVSQPGFHISLQPDSCVCYGCDLDFSRNKRYHVSPRWLKLRDDMYIQRHCILCCQSNSFQCAKIEEWGPSTWHADQSVEWWGRYFVHKGVCSSVNTTAMDICRHHLRELRISLSKRVCLKCSSGYTEKWFPAGSEFGTDEFEWICKMCETCSHGKQRIEDMLKIDKGSEDQIRKTRAELIERALSDMKVNTFVYTLPLLDSFKRCMGDNINFDKKSSYLRSFTVCMDKYLTCHGFKSYCGVNKSGKLYYDDSIHNIKGVEHVYKLAVDKYKVEKENNILRDKESTITVKDLKQLIKDQCSKFPTSLHFDYRTLVTDGVMDDSKLEPYFNTKLIKFVDDITTSTKSEHTTHSQLYTDMRKLRTYMIISLLCYTKNPSIVFFQTIIGLFCYAYGLRDKGFEILNAFGCSCSIDHVRRHGDYWSSHRSALNELDVKKLWRISFDNLNFKMKYSKDLKSDGGPDRALNLITGQVAHTHKQESTCVHEVPSLKELSQNKLKTFVHPHSISQQNLQDCNFYVSESESDYYLHVFNRAVFNCTSTRLNQSIDNLDSTLIEDLRRHLPHWTPPTGDKVVYTTVEEAGSAKVSDVGTNLDKLKSDLHIERRVIRKKYF